MSILIHQPAKMAGEISPNAIRLLVDCGREPYALCIVIPKYDIYVDGEAGVHIYRFNKITGVFETLQVNGKDWSPGLVDYVDVKGIKHLGTWKEK